MIKTIIIITFFIILTSCKSAQDALTLQKRTNSDEFLVEKKNPLTVPPDFNKLPNPDNIQNSNSSFGEIDETISQKNTIEILINDKGVKKNRETTYSEKKSSIEKTILNKIK